MTISFKRMLLGLVMAVLLMVVASQQIALVRIKHQLLAWQDQGKIQLTDLTISHGLITSQMDFHLQTNIAEQALHVIVRVLPGPIWKTEQGWQIGMSGASAQIDLPKELPDAKLTLLAWQSLPQKFHLWLDLNQLPAVLLGKQINVANLTGDLLLDHEHVEWLRFNVKQVALQDLVQVWNLNQVAFDYQQGTKITDKHASLKFGQVTQGSLNGQALWQMDDIRFNLEQNLVDGQLINRLMTSVPKNEFVGKIVGPVNISIKSSSDLKQYEAWSNAMVSLNQLIEHSRLSLERMNVVLPLARVQGEGDLNPNQGQMTLTLTPQRITVESEPFWIMLQQSFRTWLDDAEQSGWLVKQDNNLVMKLTYEKDHLLFNGKGLEDSPSDITAVDDGVPKTSV